MNYQIANSLEKRKMLLRMEHCALYGNLNIWGGREREWRLLKWRAIENEY